MASSFLQWDSPIVDLDSASAMTAFFNNFDTKMVELGLIKIPSESTNYIHPPNWPTTTTFQKAVIITLSYELPKGFAKTEFEDVPGQTYKKIKQASYYKTDTQVKFEFMLVKGSPLNLSLSDPAYLNKTSIMYCELYSRNSNLHNWTSLGSMGCYDGINNNSLTFANGGRLPARPNYAIHTEDALIIYFGNVVYPQSSFLQHTSGNFPIINFILKRSQKYNAHSIIYSTQGRQSTTSVLNMTAFENGSTTSYLHEDRAQSFFTWHFQVSDSVYNGELVMYPLVQVNRTKRTNEVSYVTKSIPEAEVITENNAVIKYKNTPILISTINMGKYSKQLTFGNYFFTLIHMKPNYPVITGDLT